MINIAPFFLPKKGSWFKNRLISAVGLLLLLSSLILFNLIVQNLGLQTDMTEAKLYSLDQQSINLLVNSLTDEVTITFLAEEKDFSEILFKQINEVLLLYKKNSSNITYQIVNPNHNPALLSRFNIDGKPLGLAHIIVSNSRFFKVIPPSALVSYNSSSGETPRPSSLNVESRVSSAIEFIGNGRISKAYNLTGHAEASLYDIATTNTNSLATMLENESYIIENLSLATKTVPADASILFILNPRSDIALYEQEVVAAYLERGGKIFINIELTDQPFPRLEALLLSYGIVLARNIVAEYESKALIPALNGNNLFFTASQPPHPINQPLIDRSATVIIGQGINLTTSSNVLRTVTISPLLQSSGKAKIVYLERDNRSERMETGVATVAVAMEKQLEEADKMAKVILLTGRLELLQQADGSSWFLNAVNWLNQSSHLVKIDQKNLYELPLRFTGLLPVLLLATLFVVIIPLSFIIAAVIIYLRRRHL